MANNSSHICERLIKTGYIRKPKYKSWLAKTKWSVLEASCLINGIEPFDFIKLKRIIEANSPEYINDHGFIEISKLLIADIHTKMDIILTWVPEHVRTLSPSQSEDDPLKLINKYLITIGSIPKKLLLHAKRTFMILYQSREVNEDAKKNWKDNWYLIAPAFQALINKSTDAEKEISPKKEETLLALIGILIDKHFTGNKYKKPNECHKASTISEEIMGYISSKISPDAQIPHGLKKSNLTKIINDSRYNWNKKIEA